MSVKSDKLIAHCVAITSGLDLDEVVKQTLGAVRDLAPGCQVILTRIREGAFVVLGADPPLEDTSSLPLPVGEGLAGSAVSSGGPVYTPDVQHDPRISAERAGDRDGAAFVVPLLVEGSPLGTMHVVAPRGTNLDGEVRGLAAALAPTVAAALRNALALERQRRSWDERRNLELQKAAFAWLAAHELRGPLAELQEMAARLRAHRDRAAAARLAQAATRFSDLVDANLAVATGARRDGGATCDLHDVVPAAARRSLLVEADEDRLRRVLPHLLSGEPHVSENEDEVVIGTTSSKLDPDVAAALAALAGARVDDRGLVFVRARPRRPAGTT